MKVNNPFFFECFTYPSVVLGWAVQGNCQSKVVRCLFSACLSSPATWQYLLNLFAQSGSSVGALLSHLGKPAAPNNPDYILLLS